MDEFDTLAAKLNQAREVMGEAEYSKRLAALRSQWAADDDARAAAAREAVRVQRKRLADARLATAKALAAAVDQAVSVAASLEATDAELATFATASTGDRLRNAIPSKLRELDTAAFLREADAAHVALVGEL